MSEPDKIAAEEVIDRIICLLKACPEEAAKLPEGSLTKSWWEDRLTRDERARSVLECLRELPGFTNQAPDPLTPESLRAVMERDFRSKPSTSPAQASALLGRILPLVKERPVEQPVKYWRDRFGPREVVQRVRPTETDEYLHNPHRGTTTFQRFQGDDTYPSWVTSDTHGPVDPDANAPVRDNVKYIPRTTLSYCRWPWRWLELKKGRFNWKIVDDALKTARRRGQTLQARFQPYTQRVEYAVDPIDAKRHPPERSVNVPDWYWDTGAAWIERGVYAPNEPDSNDPKYIRHFGDFIRAFAKRYDGHEDLESVDMAYAGFWGESGGNSTPETGAKLIDIYLKSFRKTQLLSMLGTPGCAHAAKKTKGTKRYVGWRADCFGDLHRTYGAGVPGELSFNHTFDVYPKQIARCGVAEAWKTAPVTMETCGNVATWFMADYDLDVIMREGYRYHMSVFMPKNVFFPEAFREKLIEFDKYIGYRLVVRQLWMPLECTPGKRIELEFFIDNVGCAPIYRPYPLALRFRQGRAQKIVRLKADIRSWMPGHTWFSERVVVPKGLKKGEVKFDVGIVDAKDRPKVAFAIREKTDDGWHPMSSMDVV